MSDIPTKRCPDCGLQPIWDFYLNSRMLDGFQPYCKTCTKRRSAASQQRRRQARKAAGLPVDERRYMDGIINQRIAARKEVKVRYRTDVYTLPDFKNYETEVEIKDFSDSEPSLFTTAYAFLRQGKPRPTEFRKLVNEEQNFSSQAGKVVPLETSALER